MTRRSMRSSTSRDVNQEKPRHKAETLNKADEEMNELIITVSTRTEKHCNSSVDTSKRVSENRKIVRPANDGTRTDDGASDANRSR